MSLGDLQVLSLRPLSRTHMGVVGDCINLAATRLNGVAGCDEIVVSNMLYQRLPDRVRAEFQELPPVDAKKSAVSAPGSSGRSSPPPAPEHIALSWGTIGSILLKRSKVALAFLSGHATLPSRRISRLPQAGSR